MNPEQALNLFAQIVNQTKFLPQEYEAVKQAFQVLNELVQRDLQAKQPVQDNGDKESSSKI